MRIGKENSKKNRENIGKFIKFVNFTLIYFKKISQQEIK